jgi:hypothetical protein
LFPAVSPPSASLHWVTDAMMIFAMAVGVTALFCYVVVRQSQSRRVNRTSSSGDSPWSADTGSDTRDSGHHHHGASADHSGSDHSGSSGDAGGDSSSGGDGGGGDGGGDGGGSD